MKNEDISRKTKERLSDSLKKLMMKKELSKITVNELVDDCDLNRNTFYYHFGDIYELMKWTLEQDTVEIISRIDPVRNAGEAVDFILDYIDKNKHIINCAYDAIGRDQLKDFFYRDMYAVVDSSLNEIRKESKRKFDKKTHEFTAMFVTEGIAGSLMNYIKKPGTYTHEEIKRMVITILDSLIKFIDFANNSVI